jgi:hypothetical protein
MRRRCPEKTYSRSADESICGRSSDDVLLALIDGFVSRSCVAFPAFVVSNSQSESIINVRQTKGIDY